MVRARAASAMIGAVLVIMALLAMVVWVVSFDLPPRSDSGPGPTEAEQFVMDYIGTLNANDPDQLSAVLGEPSDSYDVLGRLERYGGLGLRDARTSLLSEFPRIYRVRIEARSADLTPVVMTEVIEWTGSRWHMGALQASSPEAT